MTVSKSERIRCSCFETLALLSTNGSFTTFLRPPVAPPSSSRFRALHETSHGRFRS